MNKVRELANQKYIKENTLTRRYILDDHYFDVIDTQDKAYFLGLLYADGCNYEDIGLIKIDLITRDKELLEKFKQCISYTGDIHDYKEETKTFKTNNKEYQCQPTSRLSFRSSHMSRQLANKGCCSNKTYSLVFPNEDIVPLNFQNHFIRGYMDGDGGISYWIDNKNTGHKKFQINFCGTVDMIKNISNIIDNRFNCVTAISDRYPCRDNNNLQCNTCGNRVVKNILDWLYDNANIYMQRKYDKYLELIKEVDRVKNDKTLYGNARPRRKVINLHTLIIHDTLTSAAREAGINNGTMFMWCHKHQGYMYFDEYELTNQK